MDPSDIVASQVPATEYKWSPAHEHILKEWKAKAFAYLWLQTNSCYFHVSVYNWLAYVVIFASSFASATMFSLDTSRYNCGVVGLGGIPVSVVQYLVGSISLMAAILTGVIRQLKPGEMYQQHASIAKRYHTLIRSIDACLSLTSQLRPDPVTFIDKVGKELDNLANNQAEPPLSVVKKFEKIYGPLERILYGEDVVELWKLRYHTSKMEAKMKKSITFESRPSKDVSLDLNEDYNRRVNTRLQNATTTDVVYKSALYNSGQMIDLKRAPVSLKDVKTLDSDSQGSVEMDLKSMHYVPQLRSN